MKNVMFSDEQLRDALTQVHYKMLESLPDEPPKHEFSNNFQKSIEKLLMNEKRTIFFRTAYKQIAGVVLALIIGATLLFTLHSEVSASVIAWIKEEFSQFNAYWFTGKPVSNTKLPNCELIWLPEDLKCVGDESTRVGRTLLYLNPEDPKNGFTLYYEFMNEDTGLIVDMFNVEYITYSVVINGNHGELYISQEQGENHKLVWFDEVNKIGFLMTCLLEPEDILKIAENIVLLE